MVVLFDLGSGHSKVNTRQKRYLLFTKDTQWGVSELNLPFDGELTLSLELRDNVNLGAL